MGKNSDGGDKNVWKEEDIEKKEEGGGKENFRLKEQTVHRVLGQNSILDRE